MHDTEPEVKGVQVSIHDYRCMAEDFAFLGFVKPLGVIYIVAYIGIPSVYGIGYPLADKIYTTTTSCLSVCVSFYLL